MIIREASEDRARAAGVGPTGAPSGRPDQRSCNFGCRAALFLPLVGMAGFSGLAEAGHGGFRHFGSRSKVERSAFVLSTVT